MELGVTEDEINKMLAYFDPRRTGKIDYNLFVDKVTQVHAASHDIQESLEDKILNRVRQRIQEKNLSVRQAFLAFDENRDGKISSTEFLKTFRSMELGLNDDEINKVFSHFDPRRTGTIDYNTFCDRVSKTQVSAPKYDPNESRGKSKQ